MATGFMILAWCNDEGKRRARGLSIAKLMAGMRRAASGPRWEILADDDVPVVLHGPDVIIGYRHENRSGGASVSVDPDMDVAARAERLISTGWGAYVAALVHQSDIVLMADPSGARPAWTMKVPGLAIAANDLPPQLVRSIGIEPEIDHAALARALTDPASAVHLSLVRGIVPLTPGCLHPIGANAAQTIWTPAREATRTIGPDGNRLRGAVDHAAMALIQPGMLVQLSGGLDSAILLTSLSAGGYRPLAMNFATQDGAGDERGYARPIATVAGARLVEVIGAGLPNYRQIAVARPGAGPHAFGLDDVFEMSVDRLAGEHGITSVMTGQGGDAVFFQPATTLVSADLARATRFGRAFWRSLPDAARRTHSSIWPHVLAAVRDRFGQSQVPTDVLSAGLLTPEALMMAAAVDRRHPWVQEADHLPPAKRMQIVMLANSQIFHGVRASGTTPLLHPLLTQPVLEAALALPSHVLVQGNNDRGLARTIFADRLPAALLSRRSKGDASDHYSRAILANLPFLRDYLLDGRLVKVGIVERAALDMLLTRETLFFSFDYRGLATMVSCEAWLRAWTD